MLALVSGASSGIGRACAESFAQAKCDLVLVARREAKLHELATQLQEKYGVKAHAFVLDVRSRSEVQNFAEKNHSLLSGVDVLINNAGLAAGLSPIQSGSIDDWEQMIDTNIKGLLYLSRALLPLMIERSRRGNPTHVVNIGSVAGRWVYPNGNVYCATKAAVKALSEAMRVDVHGTGVRVTEIAPGMAETEFSIVRLKDQKKAQSVYQGMKPLSAEDVAETVLWCVKRPAHVNIQELVIFPTAQSAVALVAREPRGAGTA